MKKTILILCCLLSTYVQASDFMLESFSVRNAGFQFEAGQGQLTADTMVTNLKGLEMKMADGEIFFGLNENGFDISYHNLMGTFKTDDQSLFKTMGIIDLAGLNLDLETQQKIHLNIASLSMEVGDGMQELDDVRLLCQKGNQKINLDLILPCLENGALSINQITLAKESEDTMAKAISSKSMSVGTLDNFYIKIDDKKFTAQVYTTIIFKIKVSLEGTLDYNESNNEFSLNLDKAKAGWFNITSKIIDAVKNSGLEGLRVEGNTIYFKL